MNSFSTWWHRKKHRWQTLLWLFMGGLIDPPHWHLIVNKHHHLTEHILQVYYRPREEVVSHIVTSMNTVLFGLSCCNSFPVTFVWHSIVLLYYTYLSESAKTWIYLYVWVIKLYVFLLTCLYSLLQRKHIIIWLEHRNNDNEPMFHQVGKSLKQIKTCNLIVHEYKWNCHYFSKSQTSLDITNTKHE